MATALTPRPAVKLADFTQDLDLPEQELGRLLELTQELKQTPSRFARALAGHYIALLFEKPSLRTRLTFELAIKQLGGDAVTSEGPIGGREPLKDMARNLDRWVQAIVARTFSQTTIDELARWSSVPVVNALSDRYHPCQALADLFTLRERFGGLRGLKLAFVGDGNNVSHSLMLTSVRLGVDFWMAAPRGYEPDPAIVSEARKLARSTGASLRITSNPEEAISAANAVYTDVWASMGQEAEAAQRRRDFEKFQVNEEVFSLARRDAIFLHCLPARRGEEVTNAVMESQQARVFDQAENRLHTQKALLLMLLS